MSHKKLYKISISDCTTIFANFNVTPTFQRVQLYCAYNYFNKTKGRQNSKTESEYDKQLLDIGRL